MANKTSIIKKRYNRISNVFDIMDHMINDSWRKQLLNDLSGQVLEVGVGTGANFEFYSENATVTGVDFSPKMLEKADEKAHRSKAEINLKEMDIENLAFDDNSFDYVVSTCVFCSVPDPVKGLKELRRVVKPTGKIVMLEHMRSENEMVGKVLDVFNPISVGIVGANINRRTISNIYEANFKIDQQEYLMSSIMRKLILSPNK